MTWFYLALPGAFFWLGILLLPWRPTAIRETFDARSGPVAPDLSNVTALIPARNEVESIASAVEGLTRQGPGLKIVIVDDQSTDGTAAAARRAGGGNLRVIAGKPLAPGWTGKIWALEQGRAHISTRYALLLDADIALQPGGVATLREKLEIESLDFVSLMAALPMERFWDKLLLPAFIYFFRLLYPFRLSNDARFPGIAAAAGGCILLRTEVLARLGGFAPLRHELIDDCALARRFKSHGFRTWIGLTRSVYSTRRHGNLQSIWHMVARTAFTQLRYSFWMLLLVTFGLVALFCLPAATVIFASTAGARLLAATAIGAMILSYLPTLKYYRLSTSWALAMPLIGVLYLAMTWSSALRYWAGTRSAWKGRTYPRTFSSNQ